MVLSENDLIVTVVILFDMVWCLIKLLFFFLTQAVILFGT